MEDDCPRCGGTGEMEQRVCARTLASGTSALVASFMDYQNHGLLPSEGPMNSQAAYWIAAIHVLGAERARIEKARRMLEKAKAAGG